MSASLAGLAFYTREVQILAGRGADVSLSVDARSGFVIINAKMREFQYNENDTFLISVAFFAYEILKILRARLISLRLSKTC